MAPPSGPPRGTGSGAPPSRATAVRRATALGTPMERFKQFSGVYPNLSGGNAYTWNDTAAARGWLVHNSPATQSMVVFEPGVQGASSQGHVAWVDFMQPRSDG